MGLNATGYEVQADANGNIVQSAVRRRPRHNTQPGTTMGWISRGVILQTYYADEDKRNGWVDGTQKAMLSDVRTYGAYSRNLFKVPHLQAVQGLFDEDFRTPRGSSQNIDGGTLVPYPTGQEVPTHAEQLDGDHVLVGFLDNDPSQPVILPFAMAHPSARHTPLAAAGRVRRIRHQGTLLMIDNAGNFSIDGTGAASQNLGANGTETSTSGTAGSITLKTSDGSHLTSIMLNTQGQILFGSDPASPATEPFVLGNVTKAIMAQIFQALQTMQVGTAVGPSSPPLNIAAFKAAFDRFAADEHSSDFIFGRKGY